MQQDLCKMHLSDNILLSVNADGEVISAEKIPLNNGARVIMLAVETELSFEYLIDTIKAPERSDQRSKFMMRVCHLIKNGRM
jgi:hypothetical protein